MSLRACGRSNKTAGLSVFLCLFHPPPSPPTPTPTTERIIEAELIAGKTWAAPATDTAGRPLLLTASNRHLRSTRDKQAMTLALVYAMDVASKQADERGDGGVVSIVDARGVRFAHLDNAFAKLVVEVAQEHYPERALVRVICVGGVLGGVGRGGGACVCCASPPPPPLPSLPPSLSTPAHPCLWRPARLCHPHLLAPPLHRARHPGQGHLRQRGSRPRHVGERRLHRGGRPAG